jgi:hypothetical protein
VCRPRSSSWRTRSSTCGHGPPAAHRIGSGQPHPSPWTWQRSGQLGQPAAGIGCPNQRPAALPSPADRSIDPQRRPENICAHATCPGVCAVVTPSRHLSAAAARVACPRPGDPPANPSQLPAAPLQLLLQPRWAPKKVGSTCLPAVGMRGSCAPTPKATRPTPSRPAGWCACRMAWP